jgi:hypothetical protein
MVGLLERKHQRVNDIKFLTWKFYFSCSMQSLHLWFCEKIKVLAGFRRQITH